MHKKLKRSMAKIALCALTVSVLASTIASRPLEAQATSTVIISEVMPNPGQINWDGQGNVDTYADEWIELQNTTTEPLSLDGWSLCDEACHNNPITYPPYIFPENTAIPTQGNLVLYGSTPQFGLKLNDGGDTLYLADAAGLATDTVTYGSTSDDKSWFRSIDNPDSLTLGVPTPGNDVSAPVAGIVQITHTNSISPDYFNDSTLRVTWSEFQENESRISGYQYAVYEQLSDQTATTFIDWTGVELANEITIDPMAIGKRFAQNANYYVVISAVNTTGLSTEQSSAVITYDAVAPEEPANMAVADTPYDDGESLTLAWRSPVPEEVIGDIAGYTLAASEVGEGFPGETEFSVINNADLSVADDKTISYIIDGLSSGTTYYFAVKSFDYAGNVSTEYTIGEGVPIDNPPAKVTIKSKNLICTNDCTLRLEYEPSSADTVSVQAKLLDVSGKVLETRLNQSPSGTLLFTGLKLDSNYNIQFTAFDSAQQSGEVIVEIVKTLPLPVGGPAMAPQLPQVTTMETAAIQSETESFLPYKFISRAYAASPGEQKESKVEAKSQDTGKIKGGSDKKENDSENTVRSVLLIILLVAIAGASYYIYQGSTVKVDASKKKPSSKTNSKTKK